jgi:hypothetical protein
VPIGTLWKEKQRTMRADICTFSPRPRALVTLPYLATALAFLCVLAGLPAAALNRAGINQAQGAVLHIQATIVPVAISPDHRGDNQLDLPINYNFPRTGLRLSVTEEFRDLSPERERAPGEEAPLLRTTTVVPE